MRQARAFKTRRPAIRRLSRSAIPWIVVAVFCAMAIVPFLYIVSASLKDGRTLFSYPPQWIPDPITFKNYERVLGEHPFLRWTLNSVAVAGIVTVLKVFLDSMTGYAFAKMTFPGRRLLFPLMLAAVMIPPAVLIIPLFFMVRDLGWLDTYWALIIPPLANPIGVVMMTAFIRGIPSELLDAAEVDNCSPFGIYWRVVLPLVKPGLVVVGIYTFLIQYTNFIWPQVVISDPQLYTLTKGLSSLTALASVRDWGVMSAASVLIMLPITVVFVAFQRQFVSASLAGALKQ